MFKSIFSRFFNRRSKDEIQDRRNIVLKINRERLRNYLNFTACNDIIVRTNIYLDRQMKTRIDSAEQLLNYLVELISIATDDKLSNKVPNASAIIVKRQSMVSIPRWFITSDGYLDPANTIQAISRLSIALIDNTIDKIDKMDRIVGRSVEITIDEALNVINQIERLCKECRKS